MAYHRLFIGLSIPTSFLAILLTASCFGCSFDKHTAAATDSLYLYTDKVDMVYNLSRPSGKYMLPQSLMEVSALESSPPSTLLMVHDEQGVVYQYDLDEREIVGKKRFHGAGDFEGVARVDRRIFIVSSEGVLYETDFSASDRNKSISFETPLTSENDVEGLGYDPELNALLLACKEEASYEDHQVEGRAVYAWSIENKRFLEEPLFNFTEDDIDDFLEKAKGQKYDKDEINFRPSGIAYHPLQNYYYILSADGKLMLVMNKSGEIQATYPLHTHLLKKPEGICFDQEGGMYISSEGEGRRGYVVYFKPS